MNRWILALVAAAIVALGAIPGQADQTFWTIDTGKLPTPKPGASSYPVDIQYLYAPAQPACRYSRYSRHCVPVTPPPYCRPGFYCGPRPEPSRYPPLARPVAPQPLPSTKLIP